MADTKQFNPLPLLSVKSGLDSSLTQISADLEQYFDAGWDAGQESLQRAHDELHRAVGVLQMLSLEGLAVFSREFETVLQEMLAQQQEPSSLHRDTLRGALLALTQYLDSLADGASNTALRLFYSYQELHQLRGLESAFEVDLFFPEFSVDLPDEVLNVPLIPSALASVKKARAQYQRALLKWLRQDNTEQSLKTMRAAVQTVMACAPQDQQRAFWWIATGLLDCLMLDGLPAELNANKLLARIDLQMKSMVENKHRDTEYSTACNMQYMLARSEPVSETVDKIKQTYELDSYLPETQPLSHNEAVKYLDQMRSLMLEAQEALEGCSKEDADCGKRFAEKAGELHVLSEQLDRNTLQQLCKLIHATVSDEHDAEAVHRLRMELAMAMMLLNSGIENYQRLGSAFHEQVKLVSQLLQSGLQVMEQDGGLLGELTSLHCQAEEQEIMLPLANEMKANIQQVELNLNLFFSEPEKRDDLPGLRRLLTQINGGLYMLSLDQASRLIPPVQQALERYISGFNPSPAEMHAIASAVSALENYTQGLSQGQRPDTKILGEVLASIESGEFQAEQSAAAAEAVLPSGVSVREGGEDAELLEVFLEEAHEVLETLNEHLQVCQRNPHSREALVIIRRGFHTLKGSGRMVGLTNLGEVAWAVEKALNKWLQDEKPTTSAVLEMIGDAEVLFQHWVDKLRSGGTALIDATALVAAAQRIENGEEEVAPEAVVEQSVAVAEEPTDIVIGGVSLSPVLFGIATDEAASIIETLQKLILDLRKSDHPVTSHEFVRAAHTLAGISRSTGFMVIAELASALESWLQELHDNNTLLDILQVNLLDQSINALAEMVNALRGKQEPKPRADLITRLQLKKKQLKKAETKVEPIDTELPDSVSAISAESAFASEAVASEIITADSTASPSENLPFEMAFPELQNEPGEIKPAESMLGFDQSEPAVDKQPLEIEFDTNEFSFQENDTALTDSPVSDKKLSEPDMSFLSSLSMLDDAPEHKADQSTLDELKQEEHKPIDEEIDLVAYVQRVAHEEASLPLQWQSPDEPEANIKGSGIVSLSELEAAEVKAVLPGDSIFDFDMSKINFEEKAQDAPVTPIETTPDAVSAMPEFNLSDLEMDLVSASDHAEEQTQTAPAAADDSVFADPDFFKTLNQEALSQTEVAAESIPEAKKVQAQPAPKPQKKQAAVEEDMNDVAGHEKKRVIQDDLDEELLPIFLEEADELYPQLVSELNTWRENVSNAAESSKIAHKLQRGLHTLKGSARMAGAMRLGELTHRVEDVLDAAVASTRSDNELLDELENFFDRIGNALDKLRSGDVFEEVSEPAETVETVVQNEVAVNAIETPEPAAVVSTAAATTTAMASPQVVKAATPVPAVAKDKALDVAEERKDAAVLRVRSDVIDDLVNEAGEISVARSRMEVELSSFKSGLQDLTGSVQGLRKLVREIEIYAESQMQARTQIAGESAEKFDPLEFDRFTRFQELTRFMNESVHDVQTVQQTLMKNLDETSAAMSAQSKLNSVLQQSLMSIRMLPFSSTSQRLYRIVRQTAKELGKKVNLELYGTEIEMDRGVLEKMTAPFEHLLRNAIVHGLENPDLRESKGKQPIGSISLTLRQEGNEMVFEFKDDGAGLDTYKIRKKAIEQGMLGADEIISEEKVMLLIFEKGLSTASELSEIAGRGVGMDVVLNEIKALGGRIEVASVANQGTTFTIYLPLTLAVMKALMIRAGNDTYAIPSVMVEQVQQIKPDDLVNLYRNGQADWQGKAYPLHYLPRLLGDSERTPESKPYNAVILLRSGEQRMAVHLDELMGNKEVVVKSVGEQLSRLSGIAGATVQADGKVVLILNPIPLTQQISTKAGKVLATEQKTTVRRIPVIMIVDDSLTVRKITSRLLNRVGYEVVTAKDGVDALEQLVDITPDVMLLDVEMPRMDGFELTKQLRRDPKTRDLPIIMITSRTAEKHRNYALEMGVNEYLGKPYQDEELLENIAKFAPLNESATV